MSFAHRSIRVLLAEDNVYDAELILHELTRVGFEVTSTRVDCADEFAKEVRENQWDLVLSDFSMPRFTGLDALHALRAVNEETPLIIITGSIDEETAVMCLKYGAENYILKQNLSRLGPAAIHALQILDDRRTRRLLERENAQLQAQLLHSQKMETVGTLAAGVAHDVNNVITAIIGYADIISNSAESDSKIVKLAEGIIEASKQATGVTRSLLTFSRKTESEKEVISLERFTRNSLALVRQLLPAAIQIVENIPDHEKIFVKIDTSQMQQVLMNLVVNARDAMPEGGKLQVSVSQDSIKSFPLLQRSGGSTSEVAVLKVSDSGSGIPEEIRSRIFDPFFTTKPAGSGTGLGLAIVHGIVTEHNGSIEIESKQGQGTTFTVALPLEARAEISPIQQVTLKGQGETILVIEDNPQMLALLTLSLRNIGFNVISAPDGEIGMRLFEQHADQLFFVLMDVDVPKKNGLLCLDEIRSLKKDMPAVIMSGYEGHSLGLSIPPHTAFLPKPFQINKLHTAIANATTGSTT